MKSWLSDHHVKRSCFILSLFFIASCQDNTSSEKVSELSVLFEKVTEKEQFKEGVNYLFLHNKQGCPGCVNSLLSQALSELDEDDPTELIIIDSWKRTPTSLQKLGGYKNVHLIREDEFERIGIRIRSFPVFLKKNNNTIKHYKITGKNLKLLKKEMSWYRNAQIGSVKPGEDSKFLL